MEIILECIEVGFVNIGIREQAALRILTINEVTWFFPSNVYLLNQ